MDGGVSQNDFVVQLLADLTGLKVERPESSEMTMLGAAFLAGLHGGKWVLRLSPNSNCLYFSHFSVCRHFLPIFFHPSVTILLF